MCQNIMTMAVDSFKTKKQRWNFWNEKVAKSTVSNQKVANLTVSNESSKVNIFELKISEFATFEWKSS